MGIMQAFKKEWERIKGEAKGVQKEIEEGREENERKAREWSEKTKSFGFGMAKLGAVATVFLTIPILSFVILGPIVGVTAFIIGACLLIAIFRKGNKK